jgi:hypothetical protein
MHRLRLVSRVGADLTRICVLVQAEAGSSQKASRLELQNKKLQVATIVLLRSI